MARADGVLRVFWALKRAVIAAETVTAQALAGTGVALAIVRALACARLFSAACVALVAGAAHASGSAASAVTEAVAATLDISRDAAKHTLRCWALRQLLLARCTEVRARTATHATPAVACAVARAFFCTGASDLGTRLARDRNIARSTLELGRTRAFTRERAAAAKIFAVAYTLFSGWTALE